MMFFGAQRRVFVCLWPLFRLRCRSCALALGLQLAISLQALAQEDNHAVQMEAAERSHMMVSPALALAALPAASFAPLLRQPFLQKTLMVGGASFIGLWWWQRRSLNLTPSWFAASGDFLSSKPSPSLPSQVQQKSSGASPSPDPLRPLAPPVFLSETEEARDERGVSDHVHISGDSASSVTCADHSACRSEVRRVWQAWSTESFAVTQLRMAQALRRLGWPTARSQIGEEQLKKWLKSFLYRSDLFSYHVILSRILRVKGMSRRQLAQLWGVHLAEVGRAEISLQREFLKLEKQAAGGAASHLPVPHMHPPPPPPSREVEDRSFPAAAVMQQLTEQEYIHPRDAALAQTIVGRLLHVDLRSVQQRKVMRALLSAPWVSRKEAGDYLSAAEFLEGTASPIALKEMRSLLTLYLSTTAKRFARKEDLMEYQHRLLEALTLHSNALPSSFFGIKKQLQPLVRFCRKHIKSDLHRSLFLVELWELPRISDGQKMRLWQISAEEIRRISDVMRRRYQEFRASYSSMGPPRGEQHPPPPQISSSSLSLKDHHRLFKHLSYYKQVHIAFGFNVDLRGVLQFYSLAQQYLFSLAADLEQHVFLHLVLRQTFTSPEDSSSLQRPEDLAALYGSTPDEVLQMQQKLSTEFSLRVQDMVEWQRRQLALLKPAEIERIALRMLKNLGEDDMRHLISNLPFSLKDRSAIQVGSSFVRKMEDFLTEGVFLPGEKVMVLTHLLPLLPPFPSLRRNAGFLPTRVGYLKGRLRKALLHITPHG